MLQLKTLQIPKENLFSLKDSKITCKAVFGVESVPLESVFSLLVLAEIPPKYPICQ